MRWFAPGWFGPGWSGPSRLDQGWLGHGRKISALLVLLISLSGAGQAFAQKGKPAKAPVKKSAAPAKKSSAPARPGASRRTVATRKTPAGKSASTTRTASRKAVRGKTVAAVKRPPAPTNQRQPTRDRFTEIQQALANAGYFTSEPDGNWNGESIEAMRAFQAANGFEPTGKIDSRSLIKLGLGPQYGAINAENPAPQPAADARQPG